MKGCVDIGVLKLVNSLGLHWTAVEEIVVLTGGETINACKKIEGYYFGSIFLTLLCPHIIITNTIRGILITRMDSLILAAIDLLLRWLTAVYVSLLQGGVGAILLADSQATNLLPNRKFWPVLGHGTSGKVVFECCLLGARGLWVYLADLLFDSLALDDIKLVLLEFHFLFFANRLPPFSIRYLSSLVDIWSNHAVILLHPLLGVNFLSFFRGNVARGVKSPLGAVRSTAPDAFGRCGTLLFDIAAAWAAERHVKTG